MSEEFLQNEVFEKVWKNAVIYVGYKGKPTKRKREIEVFLFSRFEHEGNKLFLNIGAGFDLTKIDQELELPLDKEELKLMVSTMLSVGNPALWSIDDIMYSSAEEEMSADCIKRGLTRVRF